MTEADKKTIYITGMGAVTPLGVGVDEFWTGLIEGRSGVVRVIKEGDEDMSFSAGLVSGFNARDHLSVKLVQDLEPFARYAYTAALEAVRMSALDTDSDRVGIVMGTALSGLNIIGETDSLRVTKGRQAGPKFLTKAMGNMAASYFAINHGIKGPDMTVTTACASGGDAIALAAMMIRFEMADAVVVMAGENAICPSLIQCLRKIGATSKTGEARPFDIDRDGFVLGEGGGALVLESAESAKARGAKPLGVLLGWSNNNDAYNPVSPDPRGEGAIRCMEKALECAGIGAGEVGYINAHGTATRVGDIAEANAILKVFGRDVPVSSTKGATGHMMGAGGILETICAVKAVQTGVMPPNTGCARKDPECGINVIEKSAARARVNIAMSDSLGFGGQNSCIIVARA